MLVGLLIVVLIVVALLAIPVELDVAIAWPDDEESRVVLTWAYGFVSTEIPVNTAAVSEKAAREADESARNRKGKPQNVLAAIRQRAFRERTWRYAADMWRSVTKENVRLSARIGLGDPADTGRLWALLGPLSAMLGRIRDAAVVIEPDFADPTLEVHGSGNVKLVPLRVVALSIGLLFSPAVWRGLRAMRA